MFDRFNRARAEAAIDLLPVMNLFVVLIPFLLLSAAFFHVGVIPTSLPSQSVSTSGITEELQSVTVTLQVEEGRIHVSIANPSIAQEELDEMSTSIAQTGDGPDLEKLTRALYEVKRRYERSDTVIVLPGEGAVYHDVVRILDATREIELEPVGDAEPKRVPLFPVVVLSKKV